MDDKTQEVAYLRRQLSGEAGEIQRLRSLNGKTSSLLRVLQKELLASEDERNQAEKSLKELRQMAVPFLPLIFVVSRCWFLKSVYVFLQSSKVPTHVAYIKKNACSSNSGLKYPGRMALLPACCKVRSCPLKPCLKSQQRARA